MAQTPLHGETIDIGGGKASTEIKDRAIESLTSETPWPKAVAYVVCPDQWKTISQNPGYYQTDYDLLIFSNNIDQIIPIMRGKSILDVGPG